ncbi:hypothetical protein CC79DRAFT_1049390 [Sarocladium strictum]
MLTYLVSLLSFAWFYSWDVMRQACGNVGDWMSKFTSLRFGRHFDRRRGMLHPRHLTCWLYQSGHPASRGWKRGFERASQVASPTREHEEDDHKAHQHQASFSGLIAEMPEVDTSASCRDSWAFHPGNPGKAYNRVCVSAWVRVLCKRRSESVCGSTKVKADRQPPSLRIKQVG